MLPKQVTRPPGIARGFSFAWDPSCVPASARLAQLAWRSSPGSAPELELHLVSHKVRQESGRSPGRVRAESQLDSLAELR